MPRTSRMSSLWVSCPQFPAALEILVEFWSGSVIWICLFVVGHKPGRQDPYCVFSCGNTNHRSKTDTGGVDLCSFGLWGTGGYSCLPTSNQSCICILLTSWLCPMLHCRWRQAPSKFCGVSGGVLLVAPCRGCCVGTEASARKRNCLHCRCGMSLMNSQTSPAT